MGRIGAVIAAFTLLIAPWASAGTFDALADAQAYKPAASRYLAPGSIVKAEFKSSHTRGGSGMETESDTLLPEEAPGESGPRVTSKPAAAREDGAFGKMAPPPRTAQRKRTGKRNRRETTKKSDDLESELEKDLVLAPPPPKADEEADALSPKLRRAKKSRRKPRTRVRRVSPVEPDNYAVSQSQVRKVRPLSRNLWNVPAGSHNPRACPG